VCTTLFETQSLIITIKSIRGTQCNVKNNKTYLNICIGQYGHSLWNKFIQPAKFWSVCFDVLRKRVRRKLNGCKLAPGGFSKFVLPQHVSYFMVGLL
jgi:hypothetical protein